ncbi:hypothetical protein Tco_1021469 [Tanacetum coccineum]
MAVGCGVGVGFGLVGGMDFGGSGWNHLRIAFGFRIGCGVGAGFNDSIDMELNLNVYTEKNGLVVIGLSSDGNMLSYGLSSQLWLEEYKVYKSQYGSSCIVQCILKCAEESIYAEGSMYAKGFMDVEWSMYVEGFLIQYLNVFLERIGLMVFGSISDGNKLVMNARI